MKPLSRTVGENRVVDELIVSFTHDREMRVYLPGVAPTGRKVVLPHAGAPEASLASGEGDIPAGVSKDMKMRDYDRVSQPSA